MSVFDLFLADVANTEPWRSSLDDPKSWHSGHYELLQRLLYGLEINDDDCALNLYGPMRRLLSSKRYTVREKLAGIDVLIEPYCKVRH